MQFQPTGGIWGDVVYIKYRRKSIMSNPNLVLQADAIGYLIVIGLVLVIGAGCLCRVYYNLFCNLLLYGDPAGEYCER
jgi:hypothetical protein